MTITSVLIQGQIETQFSYSNGSDTLCEKGDLTNMPELGPHGRLVDSCMVPIIRKLRASGTDTIACCCGHGKYPMTVIYRAMGGNAIEYYTCTILTNKDGSMRTRLFYKVDDDGYYFIPEVDQDGD